MDLIEFAFRLTLIVYLSAIIGSRLNQAHIYDVAPLQAHSTQPIDAESCLPIISAADVPKGLLQHRQTSAKSPHLEFIE